MLVFSQHCTLLVLVKFLCQACWKGGGKGAYSQPDFGPVLTARPSRFLAPHITRPSRFSNLATCLYAGEMITPATELETLLKVIGIASLSRASQSSILFNRTTYFSYKQTKLWCDSFCHSLQKKHSCLRLSVNAGRIFWSVKYAADITFRLFSCH